VETAFSVGSSPKLYNEDPRQAGRIELSRLEAGSYTCTVALRIVGGDEKGALCLGV
jgi:hypothetical protein